MPYAGTPAEAHRGKNLIELISGLIITGGDGCGVPTAFRVCLMDYGCPWPPMEPKGYQTMYDIGIPYIGATACMYATELLLTSPQIIHPLGCAQSHYAGGVGCGGTQKGPYIDYYF